MNDYNAVLCGADTLNIYPICEKVVELVFKTRKCDVFTAVITGEQTSEFADRLTARFANRVRVVPVTIPPGTQVTEAEAAREAVLHSVGYLDLVLVHPASFGCVSLEPGDLYFQHCILQFLNVTENLLSLLKPNGRFVNLTLPYIVPQFQNCSRKIQKMLLSSKLNLELFYSLSHRYAEAIRSKTYEVDQWSSDYVVMAHVFCYAAILMINRNRTLELDRLQPNCNSGCLIYSVAPSVLPHMKSGLDDTHTKEIADALAGVFTKPDKICGSVLIGQHAVPLNCKLEELSTLLSAGENIDWSFSLTEHLINPLLYHRSSEFSSLPGQSQFEPFSMCSSSFSAKKEPAACSCTTCNCKLAIDCATGGSCKCLSCPCRTCDCQACTCTAVVECKADCKCPACECRTCECPGCNCPTYNHCAVDCNCQACTCKVADCAECVCCVKTQGRCTPECYCKKCKCGQSVQSVDSQDHVDTLSKSMAPEQVICPAEVHKCTCRNCCFNQPDGSCRSLKEGCICGGQGPYKSTDECMKNLQVYTAAGAQLQVTTTTDEQFRKVETVDTRNAQGNAQVEKTINTVNANDFTNLVNTQQAGTVSQTQWTTETTGPTTTLTVEQTRTTQSVPVHQIPPERSAMIPSQQTSSQARIVQQSYQQSTQQPSQPVLQVSEAVQVNQSGQQMYQQGVTQTTVSQQTYYQTDANQQLPRPMSAQTASHFSGSQKSASQQSVSQKSLSQTAASPAQIIQTTVSGVNVTSSGQGALSTNISPALSAPVGGEGSMQKALSPLAQGPISSLSLKQATATNQYSGFYRSASGSPLNGRDSAGFTTLQTSKSQVSAQSQYTQATQSQMPPVVTAQGGVTSGEVLVSQMSQTREQVMQSREQQVMQMRDQQMTQQMMQPQISGAYKQTTTMYTQTTGPTTTTNSNQGTTQITQAQVVYPTHTTTTAVTAQISQVSATTLTTTGSANCVTVKSKNPSGCSMDNFCIEQVPITPGLKENELLVRLEYLATNYWLVARTEVGGHIRSRGLARVLQSRNAAWATGDILCDDFPWADGEFCHVPSVCARKYNPRYAPEVYLSAYSDDAVSAQMLLKACNAEFGKTLIVNECDSPIACLACLFAKRVLNMAVIAVASSPQACQILKEQIGTNICINTANCTAGIDVNTADGQKIAYTRYLNELRAALAQLGTSHADCVIENHGGYQLDVHLALLNEQTHIAFCGLAATGSSQNASDPHEQYAYKNLNSLFTTSSSIRGYKSGCGHLSGEAKCSQHVAEVAKGFYDQTDRMMAQPDLRIPPIPRVGCESVGVDALKVLVHVANSPSPAKSCILKIHV